VPRQPGPVRIKSSRNDPSEMVPDDSLGRGSLVWPRHSWLAFS
jgi:hypothetical protein